MSAEKKTPRKPMVWMGPSRRDLRGFSDEVRQSIGFDLDTAQVGEKPESAKVMKGFGGASVLEIIADDAGGTYRAVYTVRFARLIYVLHAFQKKSKKGIATPKQEIELVKKRLKQAEKHYEQWVLDNPEQHNEEEE